MLKIKVYSIIVSKVFGVTTIGNGFFAIVKYTTTYCAFLRRAKPKI
jgi:hypothetical protein